MSSDSGRHTRSNSRCSNEPYDKEFRERVGNAVLSGRYSPKQAAEKFHVTAKSASVWKNMLESGTYMHEESHRPSFIEKKLLTEVLDATKQKQETGVCFNKRSFHDTLVHAAVETAAEEGHTPKQLTPRYVTDLKRENDVHSGKGEVIDHAHEIALRDPRHAASFAAMQHFLHQHIPRGLFFNLDKTRFDLRKIDTEKTDAVWIGERPGTVKCEDPYEHGSVGNCSVHCLILASDFGKLADVVYIVKDKYMAENEIDHYITPCLNTSTTAAGVAHLFFVGCVGHNRDPVLEWLLTNLLVDFATDVRHSLAKHNRVPVSLTMDGDPLQLQVTARQSVSDCLLLNDVWLSKSPPSCTPWCQALDAGNLFLSAKTKFRYLRDHDYEHNDPDECSELWSIFKEHVKKWPHRMLKNKQGSSELGKYFADAQKCLLMACAAMRATFTCSTAKNSFITTGISPFNPAIICSNCQYAWSVEDKERFKIAVPLLSHRFALNFELNENDFNNLNIPINNGEKDNLPIHQRRCMMLNTPAVNTELRKQAARSGNAKHK